MSIKSNPVSNDDFPIIKKSVPRIISIATAKAKRISINRPRKFTQLWANVDRSEQTKMKAHFVSDSEMGFLLYWRNSVNWTVITSHQIFGRNNGVTMTIHMQDIVEYSFGMFKGINFDPGTLEVRSKEGILNFEYELNNPGLMLMEGIDIIHMHWSRGAVELGNDQGI